MKAVTEGLGVRAAVLMASAALASTMLAPVQADAIVATTVPGSFACCYASPAFVVPQGQTLTFVNTDIQAHNIVADDVHPDGSASWCEDPGACPLFTSGSPSSVGSMTDVAGVAALPPGQYTFHCDPHPWMQATLVVV